jgi:hypothetical protein
MVLPTHDNVQTRPLFGEVLALHSDMVMVKIQGRQCAHGFEIMILYPRNSRWAPRMGQREAGFGVSYSQEHGLEPRLEPCYQPVAARKLT